MPTPGERKALLFFAALVVAGTGVRVVRAVAREPVAESDREALSRQLEAVDAARAAKAGGGRARTKREGTVASSPGASSSRRSGTRRSGAAASGASAQPFDAAERSARVAASALAARAALEESWEASHRARAAASRTAVPAARASSAAGAAPATESGSRAAPVDMDTATPAQLERLPRIGPSLARRIVEDRRRNGPFGSLQGLQRVRGVGPKMVELLRERVTFSGRRLE